MENTINISTIIVTYKRAKELADCLRSILSQTVPSKEVIVVDNAGDSETKNLAEAQKELFKDKGTNLRYLRNPREDSLTVARNIAAEYSTGELISFIDDDVVLDKDYHKEIIEVFRNNPNAHAVQGYIQISIEDYQCKSIKAKFIRFFNKIFQIGCGFEKDRCRVFPSLYVTYPLPDIQKIINCQWIAGCAGVYKRQVLQEFPFDEKLKRFAWGFDEEHGYRIFKKYPDSLLLTPEAKYWHNPSRKGRLVQRDLIYMTEVYELYVFYKMFEQNLRNKIMYLWRKIGQLMIQKIIFNLITLGRGNPKIGFLKIKYTTGAVIYCLRHKKEIKKGDLEFFNKTLFLTSERK